MYYNELSKDALAAELTRLTEKYEEFKASGLSLDMSRGKPGADQLNITEGLLSKVETSADCFTDDGVDCRNYGVLDGIPEAKKLFSDLLGIPEKNLIIAGNSSLNLMYDAVARSLIYGVAGGDGPLCRKAGIKFLCPAPGYDRHFAVTESLGFELLYVPMTENGPDMDEVERLVADETVVGIWCVPKYSNPHGITYSDDTVRRLAALKPASKNFRIMWDNAYVIHDLYSESDKLLDIFVEAKKYGNEDMVLYFASTSKISFPGAGVAVLGASDANIKQIKSVMTIQTIGHDKLNMLRHVKFFKDANGVLEHMKLHAAILRPKFEIVLNAFESELTGIASWTKPNGGYFISLDVPEGCAKRVYTLCKEAGLTLTSAGATFPYGKDPKDENLRIAPTYPSTEELKKACDILCLCVKLAAAEKAMA